MKKMLLALFVVIILVIVVVSVKTKKQAGIHNVQKPNIYDSNDFYLDVELPDCFLPETSSEIKNLLNKLRKNKDWKIVEDNKVGDKTTTELAERMHTYEMLEKNPDSPKYQVLLVNMSRMNEINKMIYFPAKLTEAKCGEKKMKLHVGNDFKTVPVSFLLVHNDVIGLLVIEWSSDSDRKFTKMAVDTVSKELK